MQYVIITSPLDRIYGTYYAKFRKMYSTAVFRSRIGYMARQAPVKSAVVKSNRGGKNTRLTRRGWPTALSAL